MEIKSLTGTRIASDNTMVGEATYAELRQAIMSCTLAPGSMLTEASVMERYKVGKSTCRLALVRLAQDGFVRSVPRQGYVVVPITMKDVEEVFALRLLLEPAAAKLAAGKVDTRGLLRIEKASRSNTVSRDKGNRIGYFLDANREFHLAIAMASGNDRLVRSISSLLDEMKRLVALGFAAKTDSPEIDGDHNKLIEALDAGDGDLAEKIAYQHIERFRDMTLEKVIQSFRRDPSEMLLTVPPGQAGK